LIFANDSISGPAAGAELGAAETDVAAAVVELDVGSSGPAIAGVVNSSPAAHAPPSVRMNRVKNQMDGTARLALRM
jgi:hypothetical protein